MCYPMYSIVPMLFKLAFVLSRIDNIEKKRKHRIHQAL